MPFGKYQGEDLSQIPTHYLEWLRDNVELRSWLDRQVREEMARRRWQSAPPRRQEVNGDRKELDDVVKTWYRRLCMRWHPDRGGSDQAMQAVNDAHVLLRELLHLDDARPHR
jgi:hypothetical protein